LQNVTVSTSGLTVSFAPTNSFLPMALFVRGRWETLLSGDVPPVTLSGTQTVIYLNYALRIVTSSEDATLVDAVTGQPTAQMGELDLAIGTTDTSGVALNTTTQLEKNTASIVLCQFTNSGTALTPVPLDNVNPPALGTLNTSGLVSTTTATCGGVVPGTDDPRLLNSRNPNALSVVDASVRVPLPSSGTNVDGSNKYDLTVDPGGISADKVIWQEATERLSDFLAWIKAQIAAINSIWTNHIGLVLGTSNTHPMPTAQQVGAAPLSHVGMQLGQSASHPASISADSGGFEVDQSTGAGNASVQDPAYAVKQSGSLVSGLLHNGDVLSTFLNALVAAPGGTPLNFTGSLGGLHDVAQVLVDHVNQTVDANPHGLTAADLGAATVSYVNTEVAATITTVENFINAKFEYTGSPSAWSANIGGLIIQGGTVVLGHNAPGTQIAFPVAFPFMCFSAWGVAQCPVGYNSGFVVVCIPATQTSFNAYCGGISDSRTCNWIAIGY
jgi:hypothetical protein